MATHTGSFQSFLVATVTSAVSRLCVPAALGEMASAPFLKETQQLKISASDTSVLPVYVVSLPL